MKTLASISAVLCITVVVAIAAPRSVVPAAQSGLAGDASGAQPHRASITVPSRPADFQSGRTGSDWWAAKPAR